MSQIHELVSRAVADRLDTLQLQTNSKLIALLDAYEAILRANGQNPATNESRKTKRALTDLARARQSLSELSSLVRLVMGAIKKEQEP